MSRKHREQRQSVDLEGVYICQSCGEEIVIPVDRTNGPRQSYVEDCPVCCAPQVISVEFDEEGDFRVCAEAE